MKRLVLAVPLLLTASNAFAGDGIARDEAGPNRDPDSKWAFELRFGAYRPQVDNGLTRPIYESYFGTQKRFMIGMQVDYEPIHIRHVGSLGFGGIWGYTRATGTAPFADGTAGSDEQTRLSQWNLAAVATARIDVLARETWIPLVPYGKVGVATSFWSSTNQRGVSQTPDGQVGQGHTNGFFYAFGGMFLLDFFDRQAAKTFSVEQGVKHTYFFAEYTVWDLRGIGQTSVMQVGDSTWTLGLAFEM
ncbi:MAG: MXAN_2562 family outer membrane beta-barrel protein [Polyangiales bacterium]